MYKRSSDNGCCFEVDSVPYAVKIADMITQNKKNRQVLVCFIKVQILPLKINNGYPYLLEIPMNNFFCILWESFRMNNNLFIYQQQFPVNTFFLFFKNRSQWITFLLFIPNNSWEIIKIFICAELFWTNNNFFLVNKNSFIDLEIHLITKEWK